MAKITKRAALDLGYTWADAGWDVVHYPKALTSRSRQVVLPVLVASRDGWSRRLDRYGVLTETSPDGNTERITLDPSITN